MCEPFIYSIADMFNTVPLPLKVPFTSFWLHDTSRLHPIPESCFCEPLNLAGLSLCSFEITALYLGAACCLRDENCLSLLSWNILTLPFGHCLTLSAKMVAVHEGTLRRRKSRPDHCKS